MLTSPLQKAKRSRCEVILRNVFRQEITKLGFQYSLQWRKRAFLVNCFQLNLVLEVR